jgi:prefoldin subunit 5
VNPLDALLAPPALVKRAFDDLHDIAQLVRRYAGLEQDLLGRVDALTADLAVMRDAVEPLAGQIGHMEQQLTGLAKEMEPIQNLAPIRRGIEPLEHSMVAVRESVDELEPMLADLDKRIQSIDPKLDEMQESIEPIGDLAEKVPGNRKRRAG